jgi:hypothetical protein
LEELMTASSGRLGAPADLAALLQDSIFNWRPIGPHLKPEVSTFTKLRRIRLNAGMTRCNAKDGPTEPRDRAVTGLAAHWGARSLMVADSIGNADR